MSRWNQLGCIVVVVAGITAAASHALVEWLGIRTGSVSRRVTGVSLARPLIYSAGSSLMGDALSWDRICLDLDQGMETWFVAGSSPSEWEPFQSLASEVKLTVLCVSPYDLNENILCDFRANVVPISWTLRDLAKAHSSWSFAKRMLSQYPLKYVRILFPTVGRSDGIMVGGRERLRQLVGPWLKISAETLPMAAGGTGTAASPEKTEKISEWPRARMLRRLASMRSACQGKHSYDGPKVLALLRMLQRGQRQGRVVVVVLPVSPAYQKDFLDTGTVRQFEQALMRAQGAYPGVQWLRLDKLPQLNSDGYFWDLVHMNKFGQQIATAAFLQVLHKPAR